MNRLSRRIKLSILSLSLIIGISIVFAGWDRWEVSNILKENQESLEIIQRFETKIKNEEHPQKSLYNLAYLHYKQNKFEEAVNALRKAQNVGTLDNKFEKKILFNLGNSLFNRSKGEEDLQKAVQNIKQSLDAYRNILEIEKNEEQFGRGEHLLDRDLVYNFTLARKRLKILLDELKKKAEEEQAQKTIYQLIQEIKEDEEKIKLMTNELIETPYSKDTAKIGKEILARRSLLPGKVEMLKKKIETLEESQKGDSLKMKPGMPLRQSHSPTI